MEYDRYDSLVALSMCIITFIIRYLQDVVNERTSLSDNDNTMINDTWLVAVIARY
jgi:branched-subunit amino acid transport protein